ncbi:hypothetical protein ATN84_18495 [Paramesorhizobium deserti]|uniref:Uncharacterized protein n=1 Tax=Paramesorhizobium deserti TaxID=1494590 RepID=A0A135HPY1_9HYPH|nr:hypothetical protein [Paramesorhizobium deserti]KXF75265.1 hypothetical protein ATN84_18495 [Paramesorhizobium deserti]
MKIKQNAVRVLATTMRRYSEANLAFKTLKHVDLEEAIENLDRAFESKLEALHSLYDVDKSDFDYFVNPDTAVLIMLRNALHHRDHELFSSWNAEMNKPGGPRRFLGAEFLLVSHRLVNPASTARQFYKIQDFLMRVDPVLQSPALENKLSSANRQSLIQHLRAGLHFDDVLRKAERERYPQKQIYLNVIPVFISAVSRVFRSLRDRGLIFEGADALDFRDHFDEKLVVDFSNLNYDKVRII